MFVLLKEFVEVYSKESNVTAVLCCLRLVIFSSEVEKSFFFLVLLLLLHFSHC